jgi:hypothetical protein
MTYALYEQGWSGMVVVSWTRAVDGVRSERPLDVVVDGEGRLEEAMAQAGWDDLDVHVLALNVDAAGRGSLGRIDVDRWRPWVLVVAQTPEAYDELALPPEYELCLFDGLSRFFVRADKATQLRPALSMPASPLDSYVLHETRAAEQERDEAVAELRRRDEEQHAEILSWRSAALREWVTSAEVGQEEDLRKQIDEHLNHVRHVDAEMAAMKRTLSWRVTRPLRTAKAVARRGGRGR